MTEEGLQSVERRAAGERRRYNRRAQPESSPPYFEVFERIAVAIERIAQSVPPEAASQRPQPHAVPKTRRPVERREAD
jgi:hypothetical protein